MYRYIIFIAGICLCSCGELTNQYYHLKSPNDNRVLTIVRIKRIFEPSEKQNKIGSGIYLLNGYIENKDPFPIEYLKLKYSDYSPIGIIWNDTILVGYNYIEKNTFVSNDKIIVYENISSIEFGNIESIYKSKTNNGKTAYDLDEIFEQYKQP